MSVYIKQRDFVRLNTVRYTLQSAVWHSERKLSMQES